MGYQRSLWRSLAGGGGGGGGDVAVVRCSCSEEQVKISFKTTVEERRVRRVYVRRWFESPRLSIASISSDERASSATPSDSSDLLPSSHRPLSLISTVSTGSGSSRDENAAPPELSAGSSDVDLNQNLRPAGGAAHEEGPGLPPERKRQSFVHNQNINNTTWTASRASSRRQKASPFIIGSMAPNPQLTYLDRVVMEIIETERMYVRDLRMIIEDYLAHIIDQSDLSIRPEQVCALFGNIEDIYEFNSELLQDLDMCDNDPVAVARCFVMKSECFEIYTQYCTNYPNSVAALTDCMRNKSLAKFFRDRQASFKRSLPLGSYLLKPVQRILKYHLLLQEIAKHFDPEEEGYEVVEEAIYTMTRVAWYINDMKRKHEHAVRLQEVQSLLLNWKGPDLTTYGELVLEGTFKVHRAKNERTLFLLDRVLLITKRRGEHYVYKAHISCSTLMLIESAKDSLSFSVTHYKHPKQPHTVQAKSVEEKKLWAHHIKRIILENHHAIIPQKAKEAILEMDSIYPARFRQSPERLKKAGSAQSDEFPQDARHGRRSSEPTKCLKSNKVSVEVRDRRCHVVTFLSNINNAHSDGEGELAPGISSSTLGSSSLGESEVDQELEEEELYGRKDSLDPAMGSEGEEEEFLLEDEQVDDFASSVLAAISCWHHTVQVFLSSAGTEAEGSDVSSNKENGRHSEEETAPAQQSSDKLPEENASKPKEISKPEPEKSCDQDHSRTTPRTPQDLKPGDDPQPAAEPSSTMPDSDSKTLSSGESSEDEEEREASGKGAVSPSILPSSVLDKASAIAQHFSNSIKRGSVPQDDTRSLGCPSPRLPSRTGSSLSLSAEACDRPLRLNSNTSDGPETELIVMSPWDDGVFDVDRSLRQRRDSTLSKQDQLLIGKIKTYYENAGSQDATFSLQRRESLTYIPTGLVRSSVSRINSVPEKEPVTNPPASTFPDPSSADPDLTSETWSHMVSSRSLDSLKSDQFSTDSGEHRRSRSESLNDYLSEDEEFRPSSEMIKIWQAMEQQVTRSQREDRGHRPREALKNCRAAICLSDTTKSRDPEPRASEHLSTITEDSTIPSLRKTKLSGLNRTGSLKNALRLFGEEAVVLRGMVPRVAQLRAEAEGDRSSQDSDQLDDGDKTKSKVLHLARQYSQRIKTPKPLVRQRSQAILGGSKGLACVMEEKESSGKPNLTLQLVPEDQATSQPLSPEDQVRSPSAAPLGRGPLRSPLSPPPPLKGFNWPDVRELRSMYSNHSRSQTVPTNRTPTPDQQYEGGRRRHSSVSSSLSATGSNGGPSHPPHGQDQHSKRLHRANSMDPRLSGEQMSELQRLQEQAAQGHYSSYYVAAEASRSDDPEHKIIVMEKLQEPEGSQTDPPEDDGDSYVQIRSPTSREKISIMAVIDRCRVYQESEEYKHREEARAKPESARAQELDKTSPEQDTAHNAAATSGSKTEGGQKSLVKNLREKFQNRS
ncbi:pleckstrin homology domain-containing family G member 3-like [Cololabis saira]|uniref:pleckstrin homology domain-containing family G member 3-like n=1 Tax=Cololabis saira TaxID=129043 RepID=UPI002AD3E02C|nr:pleckstrin homology domain-containing family G member 3-like [Cololabis saira]